MKHKSISQRLKTAKSIDTKKLVAQDWATNWQAEQTALIDMLGKALHKNNFDELCIAVGQLKAVTQKKFEGLTKVIEILSLNDKNNLT